jgi:hypothetical protein
MANKKQEDAICSEYETKKRFLFRILLLIIQIMLLIISLHGIMYYNV